MYIVDCEVCGESYYSEDNFPNEAICPECNNRILDEQIYNEYNLLEEEIDYDI